MTAAPGEERGTHAAATDKPPPSVTPALRAFVLVLCFLTFAARALTLTAEGLWLDEVDALAFAARPAADLLAMFAQPAQNGPLYYLLLKAWTALVGDGEWGLRSFSLLAGLPAVPLTWQVGRRLLGPDAAWWATVLTAASPYLFFYGQEGKMYALYLTLTLASMLLFLDGLARGGWRRWAAWLLATAAGVYVHLFFVYLPVAQHVIVLALLMAGERPGGVRGWYRTQAALLLPLLPVAAWTLPAAVEGYRTAFEARPLGVMAQVLLLRFSLNTEAVPSAVVLLGFAVPLAAAIIALGMGLRHRRSDAMGLLIVALWLLAPILAAWLTAWRAPVFMHRYFMLVVPAYVLLLAAGLSVLARRLALLGWGTAALMVGASLTAIAVPSEVRPDFRGAAAYVAARVQPGDLAVFVAGYGARAFRYYLPEDRLPGVDGPYTNDGVDANAAEAALLRNVGTGVRRVWLVEFEEWLWDSRGIAFRALTGRGSVVEAAAVPGVRLTAIDLHPQPAQG